MTPERKQQIENALSSCGPERRWKTDKVVNGAIVVGNAHFFVVLRQEEFAELGVELVDLVEGRVKAVAEQIALDSKINEVVDKVGEICAGCIDGDAFVYKFKMGWKFPVRKQFVVLMGTGLTTAVSYGGGFLLLSRGEGGQVIAGAMSLGDYEQNDIDSMIELASNSAKVANP